MFVLVIVHIPYLVDIFFKTGKRDDPDDDVLPPTCPTEISDTESEELFSSLPDLTACTQPKLPTSGYIYDYLFYFILLYIDFLFDPM